MNSDITGYKKPERVALTGEWTIRRAAEIHALLTESLRKNEEIRISLQEVSGLDLSGLQLLCSAHRTAAAGGKALLLEGPVPELFRDVIRKAGFQRRKGCAFSPNTNCLFFNGEDE